MQPDHLDCPVALACGGCALIGQGYAEQLAFKASLVRQAFADASELPLELIEDCVPAPSRAEYRNRAKLAVKHDGERVRIGLFRRGTNEIADLEPCRVQRPVIQAGMESLRSWLERHRLARPLGPVIYVDLRESAGERCHVTLVVDGRDIDAESLPVDELLGEWSAAAGIAVNFGDASSSFPMGPETRPLRGVGSFVATIPAPDGEDLEFEVPAAGFFQVATSVLPVAHDLMAFHLSGAETLFDLFCGVGVHGIAVAKRLGEGVKVVGVEDSPSLVGSAAANAALHTVDAVYETGKVEDTLSTLIEGRCNNAFIVNPGRAGCRESLVDTLASVKSTRVAYLSCNPVTLARDLSMLQDRGLRISRVVPLDLMPQTDQVETLALLYP